MRHSAVQRDHVGEVAEAVVALLAHHELGQVTFEMVANRTGISLEWIRSVFPDEDSIYLEVIEREIAREEAVGLMVPTSPDDVHAYLEDLCDITLSMSLSCATICSCALDGGFGSSGAGRSIRPWVISQFEHQWIDPLLDLGYDYTVIYPAMMTLLRTCFGLIAAIETGLLRHDVAETRLRRAIDVALEPVPLPGLPWALPLSAEVR